MKGEPHQVDRMVFLEGGRVFVAIEDEVYSISKLWWYLVLGHKMQRSGPSRIAEGIKLDTHSFYEFVFQIFEARYFSPHPNKKSWAIMHHHTLQELRCHMLQALEDDLILGY